MKKTKRPEKKPSALDKARRRIKELESQLRYANAGRDVHCDNLRQAIAQRDELRTCIDRMTGFGPAQPS